MSKLILVSLLIIVNAILGCGVEENNTLNEQPCYEELEQLINKWVNCYLMIVNVQKKLREDLIEKHKLQNQECCLQDFINKKIENIKKSENEIEDFIKNTIHVWKN